MPRRWLLQFCWMWATRECRLLLFFPHNLFKRKFPTPEITFFCIATTFNRWMSYEGWGWIAETQSSSIVVTQIKNCLVVHKSSPKTTHLGLWPKAQNDHDGHKYAWCSVAATSYPSWSYPENMAKFSAIQDKIIFLKATPHVLEPNGDQLQQVGTRIPSSFLRHSSISIITSLHLTMDLALMLLSQHPLFRLNFNLSSHSF